MWRVNWTTEAEKVLRIFEKNVILKVKAEGYDGRDGEEADTSTQWNFSGALLYSVTIITTIGKVKFIPCKTCYFAHIGKKSAKSKQMLGSAGGKSYAYI